MESFWHFVDPWTTVAGGFTASRVPRSSYRLTSRARPLVRSCLYTRSSFLSAEGMTCTPLARNSSSEKNQTAVVRSLRRADYPDLRIEQRRAPFHDGPLGRHGQRRLEDSDDSARENILALDVRRTLQCSVDPKRPSLLHALGSARDCGRRSSCLGEV